MTISSYQLALILLRELVDQFLFHSSEVLGAQADVALQLLKYFFVLDLIIGLLVLEFDEAAE